MKNTSKYKQQIETRIKELRNRLLAVESALDEPTSADLDDQSIEVEDDVVLETVGRAGVQEIVWLEKAMDRIQKGTYGICQKCDEEISPARLNAVPYALLCQNCAIPSKDDY